MRVGGWGGGWARNSLSVQNTQNDPLSVDVKKNKSNND